jgi:hypothetical protein
MAASLHERAAPKSLGATARIQVGHPGFTTFLPMISSPPRATGVRPRRPPAAGRNAKGLETVSLTGGLNAKTRREKIRGTAAALEGITGRVYADPAKALVMSYIGQLAATAMPSGACWTMAMWSYDFSAVKCFSWPTLPSPA